MMLIGMAGRGRDVSDLHHNIQGGLALSQGGLSLGGLTLGDLALGDLALQEGLALVPGAGDPPIQGGLGSHDLQGQDRQG